MQGEEVAGPDTFSSHTLLQALACNVDGQNIHTHAHTKIACHAEYSTTLFNTYKLGKVLSLCQNLKIAPKLLQINYILISKFELTYIFLKREKYSVKLNRFKISKNTNHLDSNYFDSTASFL